MAMGLDKDDTIVRRRLAQKLEFLVQDLIDVGPPTDEALELYFGSPARKSLSMAHLSLSVTNLPGREKRPARVGWELPM